MNAFKFYMPMRSSCILEVFDSYVCCSFEDHSIGGNIYFVYFVDEHNMKLWVYMIKHKHEVFKRFKILVENKSEEKIKILITGGEGEYTSKTFEEFYANRGIDHEVTTPYTPQHNGICERRNISILDMDMCMLKKRHA